MDTRLFPITQPFFRQTIEPLIARQYKRPVRPPQHGHYPFFCGVLYVLRTGIPWRDLPTCFGSWHTVYTRFKRWSENGLFWWIMVHLQQQKRVKVDFTWIDSTTIGLHRHGSGCLKKEALRPLGVDVKD